MPSCARHAVLLLALLPGCGSEGTVEPTGGGNQVYWSLALNHRAITLGLANELDTLRLVATPHASDGTTIDGLAAPAFTTSNSDVVTIDADGLLTARAATTGVMIVASLTAQGVTHTDTAMVMVTGDPGATRLGTFSIQPVAPDSAKFALGGTFTEPFRNLIPTLLDSDGTPLEGIPVRYDSRDNTTALVDSWSATITGIRPGYFTIVATATVYGQQFTDSLRYRIGLPAVAKPKMYGKMYSYVTYEVGTILPSVMKVGTGAVMELEYAMGDGGYKADIVFDNPAPVEAVPEQYSCVTYGMACDEGGNIEPFGPPTPLVDYLDYDKNRTRARRLTQPGTYHLSSATWGTTATIIVVDESVP
jgi:hypothetical protein